MHYLSPSVLAPPPLGDQKPDAWIISLIFLEAGKKSRSLVHLLIERDVSNHTSCPSSSIPLATLHTFLPSSFFPARCYTCAPDFGLALRGVARRCVAWHGNSNAIFFLLCATATTLLFFFFFYFKTPSYEFVNLLLPLLRIQCTAILCQVAKVNMTGSLPLTVLLVQKASGCWGRIQNS